VLFPLTEIALDSVFYATFNDPNKQPSDLIKLLLNSAGAMVDLIQIVDGVLLVHEVLKIKKSISLIKGTSIKTTTMMVHAGAFGLYLLSCVVLCATEWPYNLNPEGNKAFLRFLCGMIFYTFASFVS